MIKFSLIVLINVLVYTQATRTKPNVFNPVLSANAYVGHVREDESIVQVQPRIEATDSDSSDFPNGQICGYELSLHKHDDSVDQTSQRIPFMVELNNGDVVIKLKPTVDKLDCETKQIYSLFIRAYDCGNNEQRRYSERSSLTITIEDVNEFVPVFTHSNYFFKLHQDKTCTACRVEATDDDCGNVNHRVCDYQITTPQIPFTIDSNGSISITKPLIDQKYEFDVIAIDCFPLTSNENTRSISQSAKVTITIVQSCTPMITDNNPNKLIIPTDHVHIFDTVHVETCEETCVAEEIIGKVTLNTNGIDNFCNPEQCVPVNREYVLISKDSDSNKAPQENWMSFDGIKDATIVKARDFSGRLNREFIMRMWMKHGDDDDNNEKEHIFCQSDQKFRNRHHTALFIQDGYLKLLIRQGPISINDNTVYASEWMWKVPQINDDQWHSYQLSVNYPNKIDLYVDDQLFVTNEENFKVLNDLPLTIIEGTEGTVFTLGACWHGRASAMAQYFHGQLSGLLIEQMEDVDRLVPCIRDCQEYLDMPDVQSQSDITFSSNSNRSIWKIQTDSSESFEQLLKHIIYRNTLEPIGPSGQRTVSIETTLKCLGENSIYPLPLFTRRLSIDESILPTNIELKSESNIFITIEKINRGIYLFRNLSIYTDNTKKDQADINECSINTTPDLSDYEQFLLPNEYIQMNNLEKIPTRTGLVISGSAAIDTYQTILRQITFVTKSPMNYADRAFSLLCIGVNEQMASNEIHVQVHVEKQVAATAPAAAILSNKLYVDNSLMRDNLFDIEGRLDGNLSGWPIAIIICISVSVAGVLVLYLVARIRSGNRQRSQLTATGDDIHSQMEWEDDIGLNIIVNPLDETKKSVPAMNSYQMEKTMEHYDEETSSEYDEDVDEYDGDSQNDYSSEDDQDQDNNQIYSKKQGHQLEWDDEALEYGPKKV